MAPGDEADRAQLAIQTDEQAMATPWWFAPGFGLSLGALVALVRDPYWLLIPAAGGFIAFVVIALQVVTRRRGVLHRLEAMPRPLLFWSWFGSLVPIGSAALAMLVALATGQNLVLAVLVVVVATGGFAIGDHRYRVVARRLRAEAGMTG